MIANSGQHLPADEAPRAATTARRHNRRPSRWAARLFCWRRQTLSDSGRRDVTTCGVPLSVRQRVLGEYHVGNLVQARRASEEMVRAGFNTGAVPYGYRGQRVRVAPAGRRPRWRTRLVIEPVEAATVKMIFTWRGENGVTVAALHQRLLAARYPAPLDPETGRPGVWTGAAVRAILREPKYLGLQVWGRRHHGRRVPSSAWVFSPLWVHPPIVSAAEFVVANRGSRLANAVPVTGDAVTGSFDRRAAQ